MKQSYPYCKHGRYVGGCGIDYMCHDCEMGYEDPSPHEIQTWLDNLDANLDIDVAKIEGWLLTPHDGGETSYTSWPRLYAVLIRDTNRKRQGLIAELAEARRWAINEDDALWADRRMDARIAEWNAMNGDDQFNNLPLDVLDGGY